MFRMLDEQIQKIRFNDPRKRLSRAVLAQWALVQEDHADMAEFSTTRPQWPTRKPLELPTTVLGPINKGKNSPNGLKLSSIMLPPF